jgi:hypothetical protein
MSYDPPSVPRSQLTSRGKVKPLASMSGLSVLKNPRINNFVPRPYLPSSPAQALQGLRQITETSLSSSVRGSKDMEAGAQISEVTDGEDGGGRTARVPGTKTGDGPPPNPVGTSPDPTPPLRSWSPFIRNSNSSGKRVPLSFISEEDGIKYDDARKHSKIAHTDNDDYIIDEMPVDARLQSDSPIGRSTTPSPVSTIPLSISPSVIATPPDKIEVLISPGQGTFSAFPIIQSGIKQLPIVQVESKASPLIKPSEESHTSRSTASIPGGLVMPTVQNTSRSRSVDLLGYFERPTILLRMRSALKSNDLSALYTASNQLVKQLKQQGRSPTPTLNSLRQRRRPGANVSASGQISGRGIPASASSSTIFQVEEIRRALLKRDLKEIMGACQALIAKVRG